MQKLIKNTQKPFFLEAFISHKIHKDWLQIYKERYVDFKEEIEKTKLFVKILPNKKLEIIFKTKDNLFSSFLKTQQITILKAFLSKKSQKIEDYDYQLKVMN